MKLTLVLIAFRAISSMSGAEDIRHVDACKLCHLLAPILTPSSDFCNMTLPLVSSLFTVLLGSTIAHNFYSSTQSLIVVALALGSGPVVQIG